MKIVKLLHNPTAGGGEFTRKKLVSLIESAGFGCSYSSTKKKRWEKIESNDIDLIAIAGGDGTVRKVAEELLDQKILKKILPIGLLPLGTANNIAKTLNIATDPKEAIKSWHNENYARYDVGKIYGVKKAKFFLEGLGYGLFPQLMKDMDKLKKKAVDTPEKSIRTALEVLYDIISTYKACSCKIEIDGVDHSGKFLLAEVMNIRSIGPNLNLAPAADPGDGELDIVLIPEQQREEFAAYVLNKIKKIEEPPFLKTLKAKKLLIRWDGPDIHVDDEIITLDQPSEVTIELLEGILEFLVPEK